jgi:uncharacterized lipoprotein YddW (UPF0748 family)
MKVHMWVRPYRMAFHGPERGIRQISCNDQQRRRPVVVTRVAMNGIGMGQMDYRIKWGKHGL